MVKTTSNIPPIVAIDFDDTLFKGGQFPAIGEVNAEAFKELKRLKEVTGAKYILFTCRTGEHLAAAIKACHKFGISFDAINENCKEVPFPTSQKPYADYYVDDKSALGRNPFDTGFWVDFVNQVIKDWQENNLPPFFLPEEMAG